MPHRPFTADNRYIFNEAFYTTAPATIGTDSVIVTQALNRSIFDQDLTSIAGNPQPNSPACCPCPYRSFTPPPQTMQADRGYMPGGASFTFNSMPQNNALRGCCATGPYPKPQEIYQYDQFSPCFPPQAMQHTCQQPLTLEQQIALKQLEREHLEVMLIQEHIKKNPYRIRFHYNGQTSTSDLLTTQAQVPQSHGMADFKNVSSGMAEFRRDIEEIGKMGKLPPDSPPNTLCPPVSQAKRLILTKSPDIQKAQAQSSQAQSSQAQSTQSPENALICVNQAVQTKRIYRKKRKQSKENSSSSSSEDPSSDSCASECSCPDSEDDNNMNF